MSDPSAPLIDLAAETALGATDILVIAAAGGAAALYLGRSIWRKRRRLASGKGCSGCGGCGASGACASRMTLPSDAQGELAKPGASVP